MAQSQTLYFLDIGMGSNVADITQVSVSGRVLASAADGSNLRTLVSHLTDLGGCVYRFDMEGKRRSFGRLMKRILGLGFGIETWEKPFALQRLGRYEEKLVCQAASMNILCWRFLFFFFFFFFL
jgi:hypothetical protein